MNEENYFQYYVKGSQYPYSNFEGTSIMCDGESHMFPNDITITNIVIHNEETLEVADATILIEGNKMVHKEEKLVLKNCSPTQRYCYANGGVYIWTHQPPNCQLKATKRVMGELFKMNDKAFFMANDSLIYLEVRRQEKLCQRTVRATDFKGIYLLDTKTEKPIEREIEATDVSIFKDLSVRNAWIYKKLRQLIITNIQRLQRAHCIDTTYQNQQICPTPFKNKLPRHTTIPNERKIHTSFRRKYFQL